MFRLADKWFGDIPSGGANVRKLELDAPQNEARHLTLERDVPYTSIVKAYHMCERLHPNYFASDVVTDILSLGQSSRFNKTLIKEKGLFLNIDAYITGSLDPGLLIIEGKPKKGVSVESAEAAISEEIELIKNKVDEYELQKVKNKLESQHKFSLLEVLNKAMELCYYELLGNIEHVNTNIENYNSLKCDDITTLAKEILSESNCSTIHYLSKK